jgi:hypothetical protein
MTDTPKPLDDKKMITANGTHYYEINDIRLAAEWLSDVEDEQDEDVDKTLVKEWYTNKTKKAFHVWLVEKAFGTVMKK